MTPRPGDPAPAPGWYPDPDGAPGMVRWWNGAGWSDVTTPAGPGVAVRSSPVLAPPLPREPAPEPPAPAPGASRGRTAWVIGLAGVLVAVLAVVAVVLFRAPSSSGSDTAAGAVPSGPAPAGPTFAPGTVRIFDRVAGISYPFLGDGWYEYALWDQQETTSTAGEYFTTQSSVPGGGEFIAQCTSGPVADGFGWTGPGSLQPTLHAIAYSVRGNYYPGPNERRVLRDEARTVDGHAAWLYEFELSWHVPGYEATGERAALLLVDTGRPRPALLYLSIPNTHAELYGIIDKVLAAVHVI